MYKVGVIGLGQIAYHIDKDPKQSLIHLVGRESGSLSFYHIFIV